MEKRNKQSDDNPGSASCEQSGIRTLYYFALSQPRWGSALVRRQWHFRSHTWTGSDVIEIQRCFIIIDAGIDITCSKQKARPKLDVTG